MVGPLRVALGHVQAHQHANVLRHPVDVLVNLVLDLELLAERLHRRVRGVVDGDGNVVARSPRVTVECAAGDLLVPPVLGILGAVGVGRRVEADVTVPLGLQPRVDEIVAVLVADRQHAGRVEHHDPVLLQVRRGEIGLAVLGAVDGEQLGLLAQLRHRNLGRREVLLTTVDRTVTEPLALCDKQSTDRLGSRQAPAGREQHGQSQNAHR